MQTDPKEPELSHSSGGATTHFVACGTNGVFRAFVVVEKSRYLMGTTRPKQAKSIVTEYLSREEFGYQQCEFGDVVRIHDADFLVVGANGEDIVVSRSDCMAHFEQLDTIRRQNDKQKRHKEAEKNRQYEQQKKLAEEERQRNQKRLEYTERLEHRKCRMQRYFKLLRLFPELEVYRAALEREHQIQLYLEKQSVDNLDMLVIDLQKACESEMRNLLLMQDKADRLWQDRQRKIEQENSAQRRRQEQEKERQLQEDNKRKEQARLQAEQEKDLQRKEQLERWRIEQLRQAQVQEERRLQLQHQQRQKYPQELLQAQFAILPTSEELTRRLRGLTTFYPPSRDNYDAYVQQLKLLSVGCKRCLNSVSKQGDTKKWKDALSEIKRLKAECLKLADDKNWLRPEEDEA